MGFSSGAKKNERNNEMFVLSGIDYKRKHGEVFIKFFFSFNSLR